MLIIAFTMSNSSDFFLSRDTLVHMPQRIQAEISASLETSLRSNLQPLEAIVHLHHSNAVESQEKSTELAIQAVGDHNKETIELIRSHNLESRHMTTILQAKLEQMGVVISSIEHSLRHLLFFQQNPDNDHFDNELQRALSTMLQGIYLLVAAIQQLTRALL
jgi:NAD-specific glutamate dehydrogenase